MKLSDDVAPKRKSSVSTLLPISGLCILAALTLTGCQGMPEGMDSFKISLAANFAIGESAGQRGCTKEALVKALKVDGKVGLSEQQVNESGLHLCTVPWGLDSRCIAPLPHVYTEVDVICPFLFNVWELQNDLYGRGESKWLRQKMIAKCKYDEDDPRVAAKWCFTDWCVDKPLTCFSSQKAAEAAKPWEKAGTRSNHTDKNEVKFPPEPGATFSEQAADKPADDEQAKADKAELDAAQLKVDGAKKAADDEADADKKAALATELTKAEGELTAVKEKQVRANGDDAKTSSPSAAHKQAEASPVPGGRGKLVPSGHQDEVSDDASDVEEEIPDSVQDSEKPESSGASAVQVGDAESSARHQHKGARRSSIQVMQGAHLMHDRGGERV